jgi:hypothetical protein
MGRRRPWRFPPILTPPLKFRVDALNVAGDDATMRALKAFLVAPVVLEITRRFLLKPNSILEPKP